MTSEQRTKIKEYVTTQSDIAEGDLLDLVVDTVADRVLLYLNETEIPEKIERVIAQVIVSVYKRTQAEATTSGADKNVARVSDNGQVVDYTQSPTRYLFSTSDQELFTGFEKLLKPYRRVHVITS